MRNLEIKNIDCHAALAMKKNAQSGRSMIEMLGVLAIIGVLSVGGIAGYSKAMMKYRINKAIDVPFGDHRRIMMECVAIAIIVPVAMGNLTKKAALYIKKPKYSLMK